jgi:hypothetical protein
VVDLANGISDAARVNASYEHWKAGAFRRFKNHVYNHTELIASWQDLRETGARRRAVGWLLDQEQKPHRSTSTATSTHSLRNPRASHPTERSRTCSGPELGLSDAWIRALQPPLTPRC